MKTVKKAAFPPVHCPSCRKAFIQPDRTALEILCTACGHIFPVVNGYVDLLIQRPGNVPVIDASMEKKWVVKIYESPLWRRNLLLSSMFGISFIREREKILAAADMKGQESVLDLACGPGLYARAFARLAKRGTVVGFDLSEPMLTYAVEKAKAENLENMLFLRGNAMDMPFENESFDLVNCCGALHLFPEIERVMASVYGALKPGGRFTGAAARNPEGKISQWMVTAAEKKHGLTYFSRSHMEGLLKEAGFEDVQFLHEKYFWIMFCARKR